MNRPTTIKTQLQQEGPQNPKKKNILRALSQEIKEIGLLGPREYRLHKATPQRLGVIADPSTAQKQRDSQHGETENRPPMKEQEKTSVKKLSEIEASNLSDVEFKVMITRMLKKLGED